MGEANRASFFRHFRWMVIASCLAGIYIPGAEILFPRLLRKFLVYYCLMLSCLIGMDVADWTSVLILKFDELPFTLSFYLMQCIFLYSWNIVNTLYVMYHHKNFANLINLWDNALIPQLWPAKREAVLKKEISIAQKKFCLLTILFALPYVFVSGWKAFWKEELYIVSVFSNNLTLKAPTPAVIGQSFTVIVYIFRYALFESFLWMILHTILVELNYLIIALQDIVRPPEVYNEDSLGNGNVRESEDLWKITRKRLIQLINYQDVVLSFSKLVRKIFAPLIILEFFLLTVGASSLCFCVSTGAMPKDLAIMTCITLVIFSLMALLSCRLGDKMRAKSYSLAKIAFHGNWIDSPIEIRKMLLFIIMTANVRPMVISYHGFFPLLSKTFRQMTIFQYKFFRFMSDVGRH